MQTRVPPATGPRREPWRRHSSTALRWAVTTALYVAPVLPLLGAAWLLLVAGLPDYALDGDGALIELRVRNALAGRQLLGSYSRFGFDHPGPLHFYLCAPAYAATGGSTASLNLTTVVLHSAATLGVLGVAHRGFGRAALAACSLLLTVWIGQLGPILLTAWDPAMAITPTLLCFAAALAFAAGRDAALALAAVAGSFVVQAHLSLGPSVVVALATAVVARAVLRCSDGRRGVPWRAVAVAAACGVATSAFPIVEQLSATDGNLGRIVRGVARGGEHPSWTEVARIGADGIGALVARATTAGIAPFAATTLAIALAALAIAGRRRPPLTAVSGVALALTAVVFVAVRAIVGEVQPHMLAWIEAVGVLGWAIVSTTVLTWARTRPAPRALAVLVVAGLLVVATMHARTRLLVDTLTFVANPAAAALTPDLGGAADELVRALDAEGTSRVALREGPRAGPEPVLSTFVIAAGLTLALEKRGIQVTPIPGIAFAYPALRDDATPAGRPLVVLGPAARARFDPDGRLALLVDRQVWAIAIPRR